MAAAAALAGEQPTTRERHARLRRVGGSVVTRRRARLRRRVAPRRSTRSIEGSSPKPGTTTSSPALATAWKASNGGKTWTFKLRKGVKFHDGTPFNAAAVCANFDRWYNFTGAAPDSTRVVLLQHVFGGFKNRRRALGPDKALYQSCKAAATRPP